MQRAVPVCDLAAREVRGEVLSWLPPGRVQFPQVDPTCWSCWDRELD